MDGSYALVDGGAARGHETNQREALVSRRAGSDCEVLAIGRPQGSSVLALHLDDHHPSVAQLADGEGDRATGAGA